VGQKTVTDTDNVGSARCILNGLTSKCMWPVPAHLTLRYFTLQLINDYDSGNDVFSYVTGILTNTQFLYDRL